MTYGRRESTGRADALFFCTLNEGKQWGKLVLCEDRWRDLWICVREVHRKDLGFLYKEKRDTLGI